MNANSIIKDIRSELKAKANPKFAQRIKKYFREDIRTYGVQMQDVKKIAKEYYKKFRAAKDIQKAFTVAERLLASANMEEGALALEMLRGFHRLYSPKLFSLFDQWIDYLTNWANADALCCHHIAITLEQDEALTHKLLKWTKSKNRWRRRAAAVSLVEPANKGMYLHELLQVSERLMQDEDAVVQKGVGWLLREAGKKHPNEIAEFLLRWRDKTAPLILQTATEKLPPEIRTKVLNRNTA
jgi:3-methyladenine DNA glycosylase AlkD